MANLDPVQLHNYLINFFIYGLVKAEVKTTKRTNVISKATFTEAAKKIEAYMKDKGLTVERGETPEQTIENYISVYDNAGLFSKDDFIVEKKDDQIQIKVLDCPFLGGTTKLIEDGIENFGCFRMEDLRQYIDPDGKKYNFKVKNDPKKCIITISEKN